MNRKLIGLLVALVVYPIAAFAIPNTVTYQGTLKQKGIPMNGLVNLQFTFVDANNNQIPGTTLIQIPNVSVVQGLFSVPLTIPSSIDWTKTTPSILVSVNGQQLNPPQQITSNFYSIVSQSIVDGAVSTVKLALHAVTADKIALGTITTAQLSTGSITTDLIADGTVTPAKLDSSAQTQLIPSGMIAMFANGCPTGWIVFQGLQGRFPVGTDATNPSQFSIAQSGGSLTHAHSLANGAHVGYTDFLGFNGNVGIQQTTDGPMTYFTPSSRDTGTRGTFQVKLSSTTSSSNLPPYLAITFCQKR